MKKIYIRTVIMLWCFVLIWCGSKSLKDVTDTSPEVVQENSETEWNNDVKEPNEEEENNNDDESNDEENTPKEDAPFDPETYADDDIEELVWILEWLIDENQ